MMKISPLVLEIVLHYYHVVEDYPFGSDSSGMSEVINDLVIQGILKKCADPGDSRPQIKYVITPRGQAYVALLEAVPFPEMVWMTNEQKREYQRHGPCSCCSLKVDEDEAV